MDEVAWKSPNIDDSLGPSPCIDWTHSLDRSEACLCSMYKLNSRYRNKIKKNKCNHVFLFPKGVAFCGSTLPRQKSEGPVLTFGWLPPCVCVAAWCTEPEGNNKSHHQSLLGPPVVLFYPFFGEGFSTKIDYRKKGYSSSTLSAGGPSLPNSHLHLQCHQLHRRAHTAPHTTSFQLAAIARQHGVPPGISEARW